MVRLTNLADEYLDLELQKLANERGLAPWQYDALRTYVREKLGLDTTQHTHTTVTLPHRILIEKHWHALCAAAALEEANLAITTQRAHALLKHNIDLEVDPTHRLSVIGGYYRAMASRHPPLITITKENRAVIVHLTPEGRELTRTVPDVLQKYRNHVNDEFPDADNPEPTGGTSV